jgi:hypothetical protein
VDELTGNIIMERGLDHFTTGLAAVFGKMAQALKPGRPLAFTYHHNRLDAYYPVAVAILDAGLVCSASLPCPAEMGASIHISGTGSSVVDTVLVCRSTGVVSRRSLATTAEEFADLVTDDLEKLRQGGLKPTRGDTRCIIFGHLVRMTVWQLRTTWDYTLSARHKLTAVSSHLTQLPQLDEIEALLSRAELLVERYVVQEPQATYATGADEISY